MNATTLVLCKGATPLILPGMMATSALAATVAVQVDLQEIEPDNRCPPLRRGDAGILHRRQVQRKALATLSRSFVDLEYLPREPDRKALYTEEFLPKQ